MRHRYLAALVLLAAAALPAHAQSRWTVNLETRASGRVAVDSTIGFSKGADNPVAAADSVVVQVNCAASTDCRNVGAHTRQVFPDGGSTVPLPLRITRASPTEAEFVLPGSRVARGQVRTDLVITSGGTVVEFFTLVNTPPPPSPPGGGMVRQAAGDGTEAPPSDLRPLLARNCIPQLSSPPDPVYDARADLAHFVVTPIGNVVYRPGSVIDEDDEVRVHVLADPRLLPLLRVVRKSGIRSPNTLSILGAGTSLSGLGLERQAAGDETRPPPPCQVWVYSLQDFAPGKGEVEIRALTTTGSEAVGNFEFNVSTLYAGAFSLGSMRTELEAPTYGLTFNGADSVVSVRSDGDFRMKYVLMYTHFVWGKRDVQKPVRFIEHFNPSVGMVLSDIPNNWVGAVTVDALSGVYLSYGIHAGRVKRLDPESGLEVGEKFVGNSTQIPTRETWIAKPFFSLTIDVRAAADLLRTALTGAAAP
jgi:hypothetical protein